MSKKAKSKQAQVKRPKTKKPKPKKKPPAKKTVNKPGKKSKKNEFAQFRQLLQKSKKVLVSTHMLPDGDGLGAEVALYHYLKQAKKEVRVYNPDPLPNRYQFLDAHNQFIHHAESESHQSSEPWDQFDLWVIVDTNDPRRLGPLWNKLSNRADQIVFLDHHPDIIPQETLHYPPHATVVSDTESSSIGELLHGMFGDLKMTPINGDMALGLYVSVMTDTNSFRYARTTRAAHEIAGKMIQLGVNPEEVYQSIFSSKELTHIQLLGELLQSTKVSKSGKLAWMEMRLALRKKYKASADDTMSFLNLLLLLKDAEVVVIFREEDDGTMTRVSIKSKGRIVINRIAMDLGGGGHEYAAGLALSVPFEQVVETVTNRLEQLISAARGPR